MENTTFNMCFSLSVAHISCTKIHYKNKKVGDRDESYADRDQRGGSTSQPPPSILTLGLGLNVGCLNLKSHIKFCRVNSFSRPMTESLQKFVVNFFLAALILFMI